MSKFATALLVVSMAFSASVAAQQTPAAAYDEPIVLRVDTGTVLTSTGGEFASSNSGAVLVVGQKLLLNENSTATAIYDGGCEVKFDKPGVYEVPRDCCKCNAVAWVHGPSPGVAAGIIVGSALVAAALIGSDSTPAGPLSTAVRH